ncbi:unnamed protein product [Miscanthus lutarioriparius]|uniref:DNA topoisomerase n=1 Tax=Miscanthus lutarioriparius TaxID=422564 RepID=A0A811M6C9_9POAL|nr:unnamed protein product [Miscanthus lutarioriparius]
MQPGGGGAIRVLNVAEKPSVAKAVAEILSHRSMQSRAGRSQYNRIFEFNYAINGRSCHMLVTSVTGHLMELEFDDRFRRWHSCDPAELFHAPVRKSVLQDKQPIKQTLEEEARRCQWLVLWLDCDREGENIAYEVIEVCTGANRHLNIWRARFSALIDREIHESVQHLGRPNKLFADAVDARQEIDLRIGASFTRFQTTLLKDAFVIDVTGDDRNLVLSYGPCQMGRRIGQCATASILRCHHSGVPPPPSPWHLRLLRRGGILRVRYAASRPTDCSYRQTRPPVPRPPPLSSMRVLGPDRRVCAGGGPGTYEAGYATFLRSMLRLKQWGEFKGVAKFFISRASEIGDDVLNESGERLEARFVEMHRNKAVDPQCCASYIRRVLQEQEIQQRHQQQLLQQQVTAAAVQRQQ